MRIHPCALAALAAENELAILFYTADPSKPYITGSYMANARKQPTAKPRAHCPLCGSMSTTYHWWWCNATPEYLAWMNNPNRGYCEPFAGRKYNDETAPCE